MYTTNGSDGRSAAVLGAVLSGKVISGVRLQA